MGHLRNQNHRKNKGFPKRRREGDSGGGSGGMAIGAAAGAMGMATSAAMGFWALGKAKDLNDDISTLQGQITSLENSRVAITNPYAGATNLSNLITNEFANLGVATKASEFQAEQADISLANTLDTLRASGASAGGATALAMAALKSKQGISANLEQQELKNEQMRAQGQMAVNQSKLQQAQRMQDLEAQGNLFMYNEQDKRDMQKLNRTQALLDQERTNQISYQQQAMTAFGTGVGMLGDLGGAAMASSGGGG
tara:strand:+ start:171 stop:932 length:762 start_codon:yes stop_codon:yes gene_type:complete